LNGSSSVIVVSADRQPGRSGNLASNNLNVIAAEGGRVFSSISKENENNALFCW
jgi:hypothetical protein